MSTFDRIAAGLIRTYQRWISPHKGFRCAYGVLHGGDSCSQFALRSLEQSGAIKTLTALRTRFRDCRAAYNVLQSMTLEEQLEADQQRKSERLSRSDDVPCWDASMCASYAACPCDEAVGIAECWPL